MRSDSLLRQQGGLSPRVRGNPARHAHRGRPGRSIPACAGEPRTARPAGRLAEVYPRVCGGTVAGASPGRKRRGLSPRVRGNRRHAGRQPEIPGSIPACAGEPFQLLTRRNCPPVYPRVCGGTYARRNCPPPRRNGLSPRVRGNRGTARVARRRRRSIPACAGEPPDDAGSPPPPSVYPRVCGGTHRRRLTDAQRAGLSPRVRGNPAVAPAGFSAAWSIPACAGEPSP